MGFIQCAFLFILAMLVVDITASPQLLPSLLRTRRQVECKTNEDCPSNMDFCVPNPYTNKNRCVPYIA